MKFKVKDLIVMGLAVAIIYVIGKINFAFSMVIPVPGASTALRAPLYAFVLAAILCYTRKVGTISLIMCVYAFIMAVTITPFAGFAIALGGIIADIISAAFAKKYKTDKSIIISAALFAPCSLLVTLFVVTFMTTAKVHKFGSITGFIISLAFTFLFSIIGSYLSVRFLKNKVNRIEALS